MLFQKSNRQNNDSPQEPENQFAYPSIEPCLKRLDSLLGGDGAKKEKGAVIKVYLENFKSFNDTFGYHFGGLFIQEIGRFLSEIRGAEVYRTAGVEFIVLLEKANHAAAQTMADEITNRFGESWHINNMDCMASCNVGLAYYPGHAQSASEMMDNLSHAVSESAQTGQNMVITFDEDLKRKLIRRTSIARDIPKALEENRVEIRYRPSYNVEQKRFTRADCYMRLLNSDFGIIPAAEFIPIAEESGQINAISLYAIDKVCAMIARLREEKLDFETIAVPISPIQFMQDHFVEDVEAAVEKAGIPAQSLAFEVAESITLNAYANAQMRISELADLGIELVLAEFGTGYSGLNNVLNLPVKVLKLERLLIWQMDNDPRVPHLVEGLIHIAKNLGMKLIAEGVETAAQVENLKSFGCEYEQGFYYSPTMTPDELVEAFKGNIVPMEQQEQA